MWSQTYERELTDIFAVQSGIAQSVADSLKVKPMSGNVGSAIKHHVPSFETYDHVLQGMRCSLAATGQGFIAVASPVSRHTGS